MQVLPISSDEAKPWIMKRHYAKRMPCVQHAFGLYDDLKLAGVVTYGQPASPWLCKGICGEDYRLLVLELNRLCIESKNRNAASILVGLSLRTLPRSIVVSYADTQMGHIGYVYQATNWIYTGATKHRTDMYSESGHSRHNTGDSSVRQERSAKHRYVFFCGSRSERREMMAALRYPQMPYPKGDTSRYDASAEFATQPLLF